MLVTVEYAVDTVEFLVFLQFGKIERLRLFPLAYDQYPLVWFSACFSTGMSFDSFGLPLMKNVIYILVYPRIY